MFRNFLVQLTVHYSLCHLHAPSDWKETNYWKVTNSLVTAISGLIPFFLHLQVQENYQKKVSDITSLLGY